MELQHLIIFEKETFGRVMRLEARGLRRVWKGSD